MKCSVFSSPYPGTDILLRTVPEASLLNLRNLATLLEWIWSLDEKIYLLFYLWNGFLVWLEDKIFHMALRICGRKSIRATLDLCFISHCLEGECGIFLNYGLEITLIILHLNLFLFKWVFCKMCDDVSLVNRGVLRKRSCFEPWNVGIGICAPCSHLLSNKIEFSKNTYQILPLEIFTFSPLLRDICTYFDLCSALRENFLKNLFTTIWIYKVNLKKLQKRHPQRQLFLERVLCFNGI